MPMLRPFYAAGFNRRRYGLLDARGVNGIRTTAPSVPRAAESPGITSKR
jgi:hypothetical protein